MKKRFLSILLALCMALVLLPTAAQADDAPPPASGTCGDNLTWTLENGTLTISGSGKMKDYKLYNHPFEEENDAAPWYVDNPDKSPVTAVEIGDGVTHIGGFAFANCGRLTSVTIPDSVTEIGEFAFENCTNLTSVTIPDSVTEIGGLAFCRCTSLASVTIPNSVTEIGRAAFSSCLSLANVTIPNNVTEIGDFTFEYCTSLTSVTIPDSVTKIGELAFRACDSLASVTIPNSVTEIGENAFSGCTSLTDIYYGGTEEQWSGIDISDYDNDYLLNATIHFSPSAPSFTDVPDWCADPVSWAVGREITNGTGDNKFSPHDQCKHAEILTFLWRAAGKPASGAALPVDIAGKNVDWAADALRWAAEKGMVDGALDPAARCTRAEAVTYIWKALGSLAASGGASFSDVPASAAYTKAVDWAVANGVTNGYEDGTFGPDKICSRGEIVTFLYRAMN